MNILKNSAYIDFYINKKKYESYKTERGKWNYVYRELNSIFESLTKEVVDGVEIREVYTTSNEFWGQKGILLINDIGYNHANDHPLREDKLTVRYFGVNIIGVLQKEVERNHHFFTIDDDDYQIVSASSKII